MVQNWCQRRSETYLPIHLLASELGLLKCCLLLAIRAMLGCDSVSTFSHIENIVSFQTLKNKIEKLSLFRKSVIFMKKINQVHM